MIVVALSFIILLFFGIPIAYVLGLTSVISMFSTGDVSLLTSSPQRMFSGVTNYSLLAIPLFVLVGELMNSGGITSRLIYFAKVLLGHFRGGLAYVNVVANTFLASILGSANAQTAMMSRVMVPAMEREGYKRDFAAAVTVSSSLMGPIIPPSLVFILYAVVAEASVSQMFLAGILPGVLLALGLAILICIISIRDNLPKSEKSQLIHILKAFYSVVPALLVPVIILVGILSGVFTVTESSAIAALIAFIVGSFFYRELRWKNLPKILERTAINSAIVTFLVAMANIFGWVLTLEMIPQAIANLITSLSENPLVFLILVNILFLLVGMVIDGIAAIIILVPILLPVAVSYGIDPIQFGLIVSLNLTIGLITPPVGTALFITSQIGRVKIESLTRTLIPFLCVGFIVLLLVTYVPALTMWIPILFS